MTLRRRILVVFAAAVGLVAVVALTVGVQYSISTSAGLRLQSQLTPATELADGLLTAQFAATGDLNDYVLTGRPRTLRAHEVALDTADAILSELETMLGRDPRLTAELALVRAAQDTWIANDVEPTLQLMSEGRIAEAARATNAADARDAFDLMITATTTFGDVLEVRRDEARDRNNAFVRQVGFWLILMAAVLLGVLGAALIASNRWVVNPLLAIRRDLAKATKDSHTHPISPVGPPELEAVAGDAENLRRSLVAEIDQVRAARTGLAQGAPLAVELQRAFAQPALPTIPQLSIAGTTSSAEGVVSGDWWDVIAIDGGRIGVVVGDTSGHGTPATMTALRTRDIMRAALRSGLSARAAVELAESSFDTDGNFVTAFVAVVDPIRRSVEFVNAGHQPPNIVTRDKSVHRLDRTGPLLSVLGGQWEQNTIAFAPGDVLFAYTDGLIEGTGFDGLDLNADDVARVIRGLDAPVRRDAHEVLARVIAQIRERAPDWHRDDMTAVTIGHVGMAL